jgi:general nucleoside transport system permease protein
LRSIFDVEDVERAGTLNLGIAAALGLLALLGALLFAFFDALQLRLQQSGSTVLPYQMYLMLPYALSIVALVVACKASYPQALMKPCRKDER